MELLYFLKKHKDTSPLIAIEREVGIPQRTLRNVIAGKQRFPNKWNKPLSEWLLSKGKDMEATAKYLQNAHKFPRIDRKRRRDACRS